MTEGTRTKEGAGAHPASAVQCSVALCPICTLLTVTGQVRPEVVEHLLNAGRELMLAVTAVLNARANPDSAFEKIEVE